LTSYVGEIIGDYQFEFRRNRLSTDHIFFTREILGRPREHNKAVHQLFIDFKRTYDPFRREVLYNILTEFVIPMKLARPIKMCLNETGSRIRVGKHLFDIFQIKNGLKKEMPCRHYLLTLLWDKPLGGFRVSGRQGGLEIKWYASSSSLCW